MVIVLLLYGLLIYLFFFKFKVLPKNALTGTIVLLIGIILGNDREHYRFGESP